jgi:NADH-quinone oxidoreductase subunit M
MGFVTLGIFALNTNGIEGGILQMINHGIVTGGLFLSIGIIYDQTHTRKIADYGGAASVVPMYAAMFMIFTLASIGLPGMNGFVGEFLIILGGFAANKWAGVLAATGIIIGATYMLWLYQQIFFQEVNPKLKGLKDLSGREYATLLPMIALIFWIGVHPSDMLDFMHVSVQDLLTRLGHGAEALAALKQ